MFSNLVKFHTLHSPPALASILNFHRISFQSVFDPAFLWTSYFRLSVSFHFKHSLSSFTWFLAMWFPAQFVAHMQAASNTSAMRLSITHGQHSFMEMPVCGCESQERENLLSWSSVSKKVHLNDAQMETVSRATKSCQKFWSDESADWRHHFVNPRKFIWKDSTYETFFNELNFGMDGIGWYRQ